MLNNHTCGNTLQNNMQNNHKYKIRYDWKGNKYTATAENTAQKALVYSSDHESATTGLEDPSYWYQMCRCVPAHLLYKSKWPNI